MSVFSFANIKREKWALVVALGLSLLCGAGLVMLHGSASNSEVAEVVAHFTLDDVLGVVVVWFSVRLIRKAS